MRKLALLSQSLLLTLATVAGYSQAPSNYLSITITAGIVDASGTPMAQGTFCAYATDATDSPIAFEVGGSYQAVKSTVCRNIVAGTLAASLQLANPAATTPVNIRYHVTVTNSQTHVTTQYPAVSIVVANGVSTWDWSAWNPALSQPSIPENTGPVGPVGPAGPPPTVIGGTATALAAGATPTVSVTGTNPYALNVGIPSGAGPAGLAATVTLGTVTASPPTSLPSITNSGTPSAAVLNFSLPSPATQYVTQVAHTFTAAGTYNYVHSLGTLYPGMTCWVNSGSQSYSAAPVDLNTTAITVAAPAAITCTFTGVAAPVNNYAFIASPLMASGLLPLSGSGSTTFTITQVAGPGSASTVTYAATNLPTGWTAAFSPPTLTGGGSTTMTLTYPSTTASGTYTFSINPTSGSAVSSIVPFITIANLNAGITNDWLLNQGSGNSFPDLVAGGSYNMTGTPSQYTWTTVAGLGTVPVFNGTGGPVASATGTLTSLSGQVPYTVCAWVEYVSGGVVGETFAGSYLSTGGWAMRANNSSTSDALPSMVIGTLAGSAFLNIHSTTALAVGAASHVCFASDGTTTYTSPHAVFYINGVATGLATSTTGLASTAAVSSPMQIGGPSTVTGFANPFKGAVGGVRIFNVQLTAAQVLALYQGGVQ